jgi:hypothetical protein
MYSRDVVVGAEVPGTQQSQMLVNPESPRGKKKGSASNRLLPRHVLLWKYLRSKTTNLLHSTISQRSDGAYNDTFQPLEETHSQIYALLSYKAPKKQANVLT